jgi:hypothetical protein
VIGLLFLVSFWAFAEAILFFIVADVPISYIAVRFGLRPAMKAALLAAVAAAFGGCVLLAGTRVDPEAVNALLVSLPAIDSAMVADNRQAFADQGYLAVIKGSFAGVPYKLYAFSAASNLPGGILGFFAASFAARLPRFLLAAIFANILGDFLGRRFPMHMRLVALAIFWLLFYSWYFWTMPG